MLWKRIRDSIPDGRINERTRPPDDKQIGHPKLIRTPATNVTRAGESAANDVENAGLLLVLDERLERRGKGSKGWENRSHKEGFGAGAEGIEDRERVVSAGDISEAREGINDLAYRSHSKNLGCRPTRAQA